MVAVWAWRVGVERFCYRAYLQCSRTTAGISPGVRRVLFGWVAGCVVWKEGFLWWSWRGRFLSRWGGAGRDVAGLSVAELACLMGLGRGGVAGRIVVCCMCGFWDLCVGGVRVGDAASGTMDSECLLVGKEWLGLVYG